jgi:hypothetical protein
MIVVRGFIFPPLLYNTDNVSFYRLVHLMMRTGKTLPNRHLH